MKVGISTEHIDTKMTGIGNYAYNLIENILKIDKSNDYFLVHYKKNKNEIYNKAENCIINLPKIKPRELIWHIKRLPKRLEELNLDIFHSTAQLNSISHTKYKKIITIHDLAALKFPKTHTLYPRLSTKYFLPKIIKKSDKIIAVSENTKKDIVNYFKIKEEKIEVIYEGVESIFKPTKEKEVLKKYNISQPYFLYIGTIEPRKNIELIIKTFYALKKNKNIPHKLIIVGKTGWKYEPIINLLRKIDISKFNGFDKQKVLNKEYIDIIISDPIMNNMDKFERIYTISRCI